jgi:hypothetical protein
MNQSRERDPLPRRVPFRARQAETRSANPPWRLLGRVADNTRQDSLASRLRRRRFQLFQSLLRSVPRPLRILDVGGTPAFWESMTLVGEPGVKIVILNTEPLVSTMAQFECVLGDARSMPEYATNEFEVVCSNSVIEHVGDRGNQRRMAAEIARVGQRYFVQTPNRYFPIEPHFLVPGFQFLPISIQSGLLQRLNLGHVLRVPDATAARQCVSSIRLLTPSELRSLFPNSVVFRERVIGLTKSLVAYAGWEQP